MRKEWADLIATAREPLDGDDAQRRQQVRDALLAGRLEAVVEIADMLAEQANGLTADGMGKEGAVLKLVSGRVRQVAGQIANTLRDQEGGAE